MNSYNQIFFDWVYEALRPKHNTKEKNDFQTTADIFMTAKTYIVDPFNFYLLSYRTLLLKKMIQNHYQHFGARYARILVIVEVANAALYTWIIPISQTVVERSVSVLYNREIENRMLIRVVCVKNI